MKQRAFTFTATVADQDEGLLDKTALILTTHVNPGALTISDMRPAGEPDLAALARVMTAQLEAADIMTLDADTLDAVGRLFDAVTWARREQVPERRGELWRDAACANPDPSELRRTEIVGGDREGGSLNRWVIARRTDTGQHYFISTNTDETRTWRCDADGVIARHPEHGAGYREESLEAASGRGMTRAEALRIIDTANPAVALMPGFRHTWGDDDDPE